MVYSSSPDGHLVDKKGYNWHMSARPTGTSMTAAGVLAFTLTTTGDIPPGAIVIEDATTAGRLNISEGVDDELLLGISNQTRQLDDERPLTYTVAGVVEMIAGTGGVTKGDMLKPDTVSNYFGCAITDAVVDSLAKEKKRFGKALTTATVGNRFWAYVNFMN